VSSSRKGEDEGEEDDDMWASMPVISGKRKLKNVSMSNKQKR